MKFRWLFDKFFCGNEHILSVFAIKRRAVGETTRRDDDYGNMVQDR